MTLADDVSTRLLELIAEGKFAPLTQLPSESQLGDLLGASRLTVREALKGLSSQGIVSIVQGRGTFVTKLSEWLSIPAVSTMLLAHGSELDASGQLLGLRRLIEVGAAELAAKNRTDDRLNELQECLKAMRTSHYRSDVNSFAAADIQFHEVILRASDNVLLPVVMHQLSPLLATSRVETSSIPLIRKNAIQFHTQILCAIEDSDSDGARLAMEAHMDQTLDDLGAYVRGKAEGAR